MTMKLSIGEKSRRANIRKMQKIGRVNAAARADRAAEAVENHLFAMAARRADAENDRAVARLRGLARRDEHNAALRAAAAERRAAAKVDAAAPVAQVVANDNENALSKAG